MAAHSTAAFSADDFKGPGDTPVFLDADGKHHPEGGWTILALIFTLTLVLITLVGSVWVMYHLDTNMMPADHGMHMPAPQSVPVEPGPAAPPHQHQH